MFIGAHTARALPSFITLNNTPGGLLSMKAITFVLATLLARLILDVEAIVSPIDRHTDWNATYPHP